MEFTAVWKYIQIMQDKQKPSSKSNNAKQLHGQKHVTCVQSLKVVQRLDALIAVLRRRQKMTCTWRHRRGVSFTPFSLPQGKSVAKKCSGGVQWLLSQREHSSYSKLDHRPLSAWANSEKMSLELSGGPCLGSSSNFWLPVLAFLWRLECDMLSRQRV